MLTETLLIYGAGVATVSAGAAWWLTRRGKSKLRKAGEGAALPQPFAKESEAVAPGGAAAKTGLAGPVEARLERTRAHLYSKLSRWFLSSASPRDNQEWEALEEALLEADVGVTTSTLLVARVKARLASTDEAPKLALLNLFQEEAESLCRLAGGHDPLSAGLPLPKPWVISVVGVNGAGKTTTAGKLAHYFARQEKKVLIGAGDTFRAAAIDQLQVWAERAAVDFVRGREGADPGAVAFDSVEAARARGCDILVFDTAGRLHTKSDLMAELQKIHRVMKKVVAEAPHEVWLVLDGTLGQNSLHQARQFSQVLGVTGLIVTKLDGTAKGGALIGITAELKTPVRFLGVGEKIDDLVPFNPKTFAQALWSPDR